MLVELVLDAVSRLVVEVAAPAAHVDELLVLNHDSGR